MNAALQASPEVQWQVKERKAAAELGLNDDGLEPEPWSTNNVPAGPREVGSAVRTMPATTKSAPSKP